MIQKAKPISVIAVSILLGTCRRISSWILPQFSRVPKRINAGTVAVNSQSDVFFDGDSDPDCPDEDECEIDWGAMPGFEDDEEDEEKKEESAQAQTEISSDVETHLFGDEMDELEPQEAYVRQVERSVDKSRTILEMNWQIEDCIVDEDSCTDFCSECAGSGKTWCKFCRGTGMIVFEKDFRPCLLCVEGRVDCSTCAGTGKISSWAKTHDKTL